MALLITQGLGEMGDGSKSALLTTMGLGETQMDTPSCLTLQVYGVNNYYAYLDIVFSQNLQGLQAGAGNPANWSITSDTGTPVQVLSAVSDLYRIRLVTTEQTQNAIYTIDFPDFGIVDVNGNELLPGVTVQFTGHYANAPGVALTRSVDARLLDVIFTEPVLEADALTLTNYSISPSLAVTGVERITDLHYRLHTGHQVLLQSYTVTVSNIRDAAGNPIP